MFLGINVDRRGVVTRENLRALCENHHLPADPDVVDAGRAVQIILAPVLLPVGQVIRNHPIVVALHPKTGTGGG